MALKITFINAGYGDAVFIEAGEGQKPFRIFIDGGSGEEAEYKETGTGRVRAGFYLRRLGVSEIDLFIITHIHEDHVCGIEPFIMDGLKVRELWAPWIVPPRLWGVFPDAGPGLSGSCEKFLAALNSYNRMFEKLSRSGCLVRQMTGPRKSCPVADDLFVDVLSPSKTMAGEAASGLEALYRAEGKETFISRLEALDRRMNDFSQVLRFTHGNRRILLPGDACPSEAAMAAWKKDMLEAEVLKLSHHGQRDSISAAFIRAVMPKTIVTCVSSDRRYNSACPKVYECIQRVTAEQRLAPRFIFTERMGLKPYEVYDDNHSAVTLVLDHGIRYDFSLLTAEAFPHPAPYCRE
jgi:competence protein ComEC